MSKTNRFNGVKISSNIGRIVTGANKDNTLETMLQKMLSDKGQATKTADISGKKKNEDGTVSSGQLDAEKNLVNNPKVEDDTKSKSEDVSKKNENETVSSGQVDADKNPANKPEKASKKTEKEAEVKKIAKYIPMKDLAVLAGKAEPHEKISAKTREMLKKANLNEENYNMLKDYFSIIYPDFYVDILVGEK